ncbi:MAG: T9SS type A sorting domain-containing protein, partial [Bacteroidota bacterium]
DGGPNDDMVVFKQNQYGTRLWVTTYNGTANLNDTAISTMWMPNGFVVVTGKCKETLNSTTKDAFVTMMIDSGTIVWTKKFFGTDSLGAVPTQMKTDAQGNIYICGYENLTGGTKNGCIIKYDSNGNQLWNISYDAGINLDDKFNSITLDNNNDILVTGQTFTTATNANYVTVKYGNGNTVINENSISGLNGSNLYPNPAKAGTGIYINTNNTSSQIPFSISDVSGKIVQRGNIYDNHFHLINQINPGTYILEFISGRKPVHQRILILE